MVPQKGVQYLTNHCPDCGNWVTAAQVDDLLLVLTYFFINGSGTWGRLLESHRGYKRKSLNADFLGTLPPPPATEKRDPMLQRAPVSAGKEAALGL